MEFQRVIEFRNYVIQSAIGIYADASLNEQKDLFDQVLIECLSAFAKYSASENNSVRNRNFDFDEHAKTIFQPVLNVLEKTSLDKYSNNFFSHVVDRICCICMLAPHQTNDITLQFGLETTPYSAKYTCSAMLHILLKVLEKIKLEDSSKQVPMYLSVANTFIVLLSQPIEITYLEPICTALHGASNMSKTWDWVHLVDKEILNNIRTACLNALQYIITLRQPTTYH